MWRNVATIDMAREPAALERLDGDAIAAEQVVEIVREAISNAVRHGRANRITVTVSAVQPADIEVIIDDNGAFTDEQRRGLGTEIMQGLTRWLRWEPSPMGGTRVTCLIAADQR